MGREKFARETGIKDTDWNKQPNKLQGAYEASDLLERFISLMRELKRFPVRAELKMKARRERGFPSATVFDRFGRSESLLSPS